MPRYHKEAEKFLAEIAADGWQSAGYTGSGHIRLTHPSGAIAFMAATPSDYRSLRNMRASLRRAVATATARH